MAARGEYGRFYKRSHNETKREALKRDPYLNVKGTINVGCPVLISPGHPFFETRRCLRRKLPQTVASSSIKIFHIYISGKSEVLDWMLQLSNRSTLILKCRQVRRLSRSHSLVPSITSVWGWWNSSWPFLTWVANIFKGILWSICVSLLSIVAVVLILGNQKLQTMTELRTFRKWQITSYYQWMLSMPLLTILRREVDDSVGLTSPRFQLCL